MAALSLIFMLLGLSVVVTIVSWWVLFGKAGKPGWTSIIPIYNLVVKLEIIGRPIWWIILLLIPFVNVIVWIIMSVDLAKVFGKTAAYGIGLALLPIVFQTMLAFGESTYRGPLGTRTSA